MEASPVPQSTPHALPAFLVFSFYDLQSICGPGNREVFDEQIYSGRKRAGRQQQRKLRSTTTPLTKSSKAREMELEAKREGDLPEKTLDEYVVGRATQPPQPKTTAKEPPRSVAAVQSKTTTPVQKPAHDPLLKGRRPSRIVPRAPARPPPTFSLDDEFPFRESSNPSSIVFPSFVNVPTSLSHFGTMDEEDAPPLRSPQHLRRRAATRKSFSDASVRSPRRCIPFLRGHFQRWSRSRRRRRRSTRGTKRRILRG